MGAPPDTRRSFKAAPRSYITRSRTRGASRRAKRLEEIIGSARMLALLPIGGGAVEATTKLSQGHFIAAGEFALGGALVSIVLATGVALAERVLAWGQEREPDRDEQTDDWSEPDDAQSRN